MNKLLKIALIATLTIPASALATDLVVSQTNEAKMYGNPKPGEYPNIDHVINKGRVIRTCLKYVQFIRTKNKGIVFSDALDKCIEDYSKKPYDETVSELSQKIKNLKPDQDK